MPMRHTIYYTNILIYIKEHGCLLVLLDNVVVAEHEAVGPPVKGEVVVGGVGRAEQLAGYVAPVGGAHRPPGHVVADNLEDLLHLPRHE